MMNKEEVYELIARAQGGDQEARELLVLENAGLVNKVATKFVNPSYELEDLIQMGFVGLIKAIDNFDLSYNVMFSTYAMPAIMGEIKRFLRDDGPVKVSRNIKRDMRYLKEIENQFEIEEGHCPRISDLARKSGFTPEYIQEILLASEETNVSSLEGLCEERDSSDIYVMASQDDSQLWAERMDIKEGIMNLENIERNIMILRYYCDMTQSQVALRLGLTQVQVCRGEKRAISKLRDKFLKCCD